MKLSSIYYEAKQNLTSGTTRATVLALVFVAITIAFAVADLHQIQSISAEATKFQDSGATISVLKAPGRIDPIACEQLNEVTGIQTAGALRSETERLTLNALPGAPVPVSNVTPTFSRLLGAHLGNTGGPIFSDQVVAYLGFKPGDTVITTQGETTVGGTYQYPTDGRTPGYGYMALIPTNDTDPYDECWAKIWPQNPQVQQLLYTAVLPADPSAPQETNPSIGQLNTTLGTTFDGASKFQERVTRFAPIIAGTLTLAIGFIALRTRRLQLASDLHTGATRDQLRNIISIETGIWVLLGTALNQGILLSYLVATRTSEQTMHDLTSLWLLGTRNTFTAIIGVIIGTTIAWLTTRETHLFKYFKAQ